MVLGWCLLEAKPFRQGLASSASRKWLDLADLGDFKYLNVRLIKITFRAPISRGCQFC